VVVRSPRTVPLVSRKERCTAGEAECLAALGLRDWAALGLFYPCGLFRAELIDLTVRDVDFERGTFFLRSGSIGTPSCPDLLSRKVCRYLAGAGIEKESSCYLSCYLVARLMLEVRVDMRYVADMLAADRLKTTQRQTHVGTERFQPIG
jgi:site-specific recombinase XerD